MSFSPEGRRAAASQLRRLSQPPYKYAVSGQARYDSWLAMVLFIGEFHMTAGRRIQSYLVSNE